MATAKPNVETNKPTQRPAPTAHQVKAKPEKPIFTDFASI